MLLASGGTGGHVFPGVHIAAALQRAGSVEITFAGVGRPAETRIINNAGYPHVVIPTVGLKGRGIKGLFQFLFSIPRALLKTIYLFRDFKPDIVVATGGYPSFFPVLVAFLFRVPRWLHEAERKPGLANTVLSIFATKVSLAFSDAKLPFWATTIFTGHPVRASLKAARRDAPPAPLPGHVLLLGGSQGARSLDTAATFLAPVFAENNIAVWHQCRVGHEDEVKEAYSRFGVVAHVESFIDDIDAAYQWSDFIIARSGAGTVSEIAVVNRPAIFVPFPFAQGNHQEANARILADAGKAYIVTEGADFESSLRTRVLELLDAETYHSLYVKPATDSTLDAADTIAAHVRELAGC